MRAMFVIGPAGLAAVGVIVLVVVVPVVEEVVEEGKKGELINIAIHSACTSTASNLPLNNIHSRIQRTLSMSSSHP